MEANTPAFENYCRICGSEQEKENLISIFSSEDLLEKITSCLPIIVHEEDELPHDICINCVSSVEKSVELCEKAKTTEHYFYSCICAPNIKNEEEEKVTIIEANEEYEDNDAKPTSLDLDGKFLCDLCGDELNNTLEVDTHIQEKHFNQLCPPPNTEIIINKICSLCGQLFDNDDMYLEHKGKKEANCTSCMKCMPSQCMLNRHIQHGCKPLLFCPHCYKFFAVYRSFLRHVQEHTVKMYEITCLTCGLTFKKRKDVHGHACGLGGNKCLTSDKRYKCNVCGLTYKREINLARHCLQHESTSTWKHKCTKCNDVFEKEKKLQTHYEKVHKMYKSWICRFCGKSLSTKLSLQIHERIHTKVKPYVCEWCGNEFRCRPNLIQHQAIHTGIRQHICHVCGKSFSRPFFLQTHLRIHTGERPYECEICQRRFTQVTDMRRHRKRHDKPSRKILQRSLKTLYIVKEKQENIEIDTSS